MKMIHHYWINPDEALPWHPPSQVKVLCGVIIDHQDHCGDIEWAHVDCEACLNHPQRSLYEIRETEL